MRGFGFLVAIISAASFAGLATIAGAQTAIPGGGFGAPAAPAGGFGAAAAGAAANAAQDAAAQATEPAQKKAVVRKKPKPKPKPKKRVAGAIGKAGPGQVLVSNNRGTGLRELSITSRSAPDKSAVLARDLAPGRKVIGKVPPKAGCEFSVAGEFEDGTALEIATVELCKDRALNLVE